MVPKGYQRYAIGISLGYRDVLKNLEKIETGVHEYLRHYQAMDKESNKDPAAATPIPSPTVRQLLQFEATIKVHKRLPYLNEKSSASGLLWTKRQLHYQTRVLGNLLETPEFYESAEEAARAAYRIVYTDYHGWAVKQIFTRSFGGSPPLDKIWLHMCPPTDSQGIHNTNINNDDYNFPPPLRTFSDVGSATSLSMSERTETQTQTPQDDNEVLVALDKFGHEIAEKWQDLLRMFNCGKEEKRKSKGSLILSSESHFNLNQFNRDMVESSLQIQKHSGGAAHISDINSVVSVSTSGFSSPSSATFEIFSQQETNLHLIQKSKRDVDDFIRGFSPMISDLGVLIDQLNMNDPSKV